MGISDENGAALGHAEFWNKRYAQAKNDNKTPTHEWFRTFESLEPFFEKHLFNVRAPESQPKILHLGSGDSVRCPLSLEFVVPNPVILSVALRTVSLEKGLGWTTYRPAEYIKGCNLMSNIWRYQCFCS